MTDVDQILRSHAAEAARAELDPAAWERLVARLEEEPPLVVPIDGRTGRRRWRGPALAAAVLVAVVGMAAAVVIDRDGDDVLTGPSSTTQPAPDATTASTTASTTSTTSAPPVVVPGPMPDAAAVVVDPDGDGLGDVGRLGGLGPAAVEDGPGALATYVPAAPVAEGEEGGPGTGALAVDVGPDGIAYFERCCEPAVGEVWAVDLATGEDRGRVAFGEAPAVSPDGRTLAAVVQGVGVQLVDLATGRATTVGAEPATGDLVIDLAWSPDGRTLARGLVRYGDDGPEGGVAATSVEVLRLDDAEPAWGSIGDAGPGWAFPAFLADGRLAVGTGTRRGPGPVTATGLSVVDPATGAVQERFGLLEITDLDGTADGRWIVAVGSGAVLRAFTGDDLADAGTVAQLDGGILSASW